MMKSYNIFHCLRILLLIIISYPAITEAADIVPFATRNQSPLIQIFGLPAIGDSAVLNRAEKQVGLSVDLASNYTSSSAAGEYILLDGESLRINMQGRYGLGKGLEIGVEIPWVVIGGGFLDDFIIKYHDAFGFPQGGRDAAPRNHLLYLYRKNNIDRLRLENSSTGIGDISLQGGWQLYKGQGDSPGAVSMRAALKLPTGDSDQLHGSGSTDLALWLSAGSAFPLPTGHFVIYGAAGLLGMTEGKILKDQQRNLVGFGSLGVGWDPFSWLALKIQADAHTPFYRESGLKEVDAYSVQLTIGGTVAFDTKTSLDIGVSEDLIVATAPDVVFHLALRRTF
jgi:hypothetical protein